MAKTKAKQPAKQEVPQFIKVIVTQEDLDSNPDLLEQGIQVGEEIEIPNPEYDAAPKESLKFSDHLRGTLEKHPHINCVWVNEKGDWHYSAKAGFRPYSREEILNG